MFKKSLLIVMAGLFLAPLPLQAQNNTQAENGAEAGEATDSPGPTRFWLASVEGGTFMVALDRIVSVSRHEYLLDGAVIVDEVTVDTTGQALARFYFISPVTEAAPGNVISKVTDRSRELVDKAASRAGTSVQDMVVKKYPDTTHAKSLEYRIGTKKQLDALFNSARNSWETGRGRKFTAK